MEKKIGVKELRRIIDIANNELKKQPSRLYSGHTELIYSEKIALIYLFAISSVLGEPITINDVDVHEDQR